MGREWHWQREDGDLTDALVLQVASDEFLACQLSNVADTMLKGVSPEAKAVIVSVIHRHRVMAMEGRARIVALDAMSGVLRDGDAQAS